MASLLERLAVHDGRPEWPCDHLVPLHLIVNFGNVVRS
ncbi:MAG: hypothetical protein JWS11_1382, partial [Cypionkella sp.]|nr:hypothetical protein [Cypionkella sp.]